MHVFVQLRIAPQNPKTPLRKHAEICFIEDNRY